MTWLSLHDLQLILQGALLTAIGVGVLEWVLAFKEFHDMLVSGGRKRRHNGFIYAFTDVGQALPCVKIGRTNNVAARLSAFRTSAPLGIFVYFVVPVQDMVYAEKLIHERYALLRIRNNFEWFYLAPHLLIETIALRIIYSDYIKLW